MASTQRFKASAIVPVQRVGEVLAAFTVLNLTVTFAPVMEAATNGSAKPAQPQIKTPTPIRNLSVHRLRPSGTRVPGGAKTSQTRAGQAILSVFDRRSVAARSVLIDAITKVGYNAHSADAYLMGLVKEGKLLRADRGVYRVPSTVESLRTQQAQDPSFSG